MPATTKAYFPGNAWSALLLTQAAGVPTNITGSFTFTVYKNGVVDTNMTIASTNRTTGVYSITSTVFASYAAGDVISIYGTAVVSGSTIGYLVDEFRLSPETRNELQVQKFPQNLLFGSLFTVVSDAGVPAGGFAISVPSGISFDDGNADLIGYSYVINPLSGGSSNAANDGIIIDNPSSGNSNVFLVSGSSYVPQPNDVIGILATPRVLSDDILLQTSTANWLLNVNVSTDVTTFAGLVQNINAHTNLLTSGATTFLIQNPVITQSGFTIAQGDDYLAADGRAVLISVPSIPSLAGGTAATYFTNLSAEALKYTCATTFSLNGSNYDMLINIPRSVSSALTPGTNYRFDVQVTLADGDRLTVAQGKLNVLGDYPLT